jgi:hypothetical protein
VISQIKYPACTAAVGRPIDAPCYFMDMKGMKLKHVFNKKISYRLKKVRLRVLPI